MAEQTHSIPQQLRFQAQGCARLGSPLYEHLLNRAADDYQQNGALSKLLAPHAQDPDDSVLPLRLMGAVHRLVLRGDVPQLARYYPSAGGTVDLRFAWPAFRQLIETQADVVAELLDAPVQTNDVGRAGSLLPGFLLIARTTKLPLRLLEIGSSAGLNLCWDHFRYEWATGAWGSSDSAVRLQDIFLGEAPDLAANVQIVERLGSDSQPIDASTKGGQLTLLSYIWADQIERIYRLKAAIDIARTVPYTLEKAGAAQWLKENLQAPTPGKATVVFHSILWQYLDKAEKEQITETLHEAGKTASHEAPLAWLRLESDSELEGQKPQLRLSIYPGFNDQLLAMSDYHAPRLEWTLANY